MMDGCSTDETIEELDSLSCDDDLRGSFIEEYSVRLEVYETEVTESDSTGSAPVIKISGLCDSGDVDQECGPRRRLTSSLKRSLGRVLGDKKARELGYCLPLSKSVQLLECYRAPLMRASGAMSTSCMTCRNHVSQTTVLSPFEDYDKLYTSRQGDISAEERLCKACSVHTFVPSKNASMASDKTCVLDKWDTSCSNSPTPRGTNSQPRKGSVTRDMKQKVFAVPRRVRKPSKKTVFPSRSLTTTNSHCRYLNHAGRSYGVEHHYRASKEHCFESCSRKHGTARITSTQMSRCSWENLSRCHVQNRYPSSTDGTYTFLEPKCHREADIARKSAFQAYRSQWPVLKTSIDCFEETLTTRLIPASFTKPARLQGGQRTVCCYVHDEINTSLKQAWGCTDLSVVHKILPPQQENKTWAPVTPNCTEPMLREVYVPPCERYQGTISSMGYDCNPNECVVPMKLKLDTSGPETVSLVTPTAGHSHNPRHSVHKQTQTSASQLELPDILNSLVDWFSLTCQNLRAQSYEVSTESTHLAKSATLQPGVTQSLQELLRTDSIVRWKMAEQIHEGIVKLTQRLTAAPASAGSQKSNATDQPQATMGGEGECASNCNKTERQFAQHKELPKRLSSRLDLCNGVDICVDLGLVEQMTGSVVGHRSCPSFK